VCHFTLAGIFATDITSSLCHYLARLAITSPQSVKQNGER
jgi:hypothetical protein